MMLSRRGSGCLITIVRTAALVKGFRTPASHWREGVHGGRRPKSLEGGNRGGGLGRRRRSAIGNWRPRLICFWISRLRQPVDVRAGRLPRPRRHGRQHHLVRQGGPATAARAQSDTGKGRGGGGTITPGIG